MVLQNGVAERHNQRNRIAEEYSKAVSIQREQTHSKSTKCDEQGLDSYYIEFPSLCESYALPSKKIESDQTTCTSTVTSANRHAVNATEKTSPRETSHSIHPTSTLRRHSQLSSAAISPTQNGGISGCRRRKRQPVPMRRPTATNAAGNVPVTTSSPRSSRISSRSVLPSTVVTTTRASERQRQDSRNGSERKPWKELADCGGELGCAVAISALAAGRESQIKGSMTREGLWHGDKRGCGDGAPAEAEGQTAPLAAVVRTCSRRSSSAEIVGDTLARAAGERVLAVRSGQRSASSCTCYCLCYGTLCRDDNIQPEDCYGEHGQDDEDELLLMSAASAHSPCSDGLQDEADECSENDTSACKEKDSSECWWSCSSSNDQASEQTWATESRLTRHFVHPAECETLASAVLRGCQTSTADHDYGLCCDHAWRHFELSLDAEFEKHSMMGSAAAASGDHGFDWNCYEDNPCIVAPISSKKYSYNNDCSSSSSSVNLAQDDGQRDCSCSYCIRDVNRFPLRHTPALCSLCGYAVEPLQQTSSSAATMAISLRPLMLPYVCRRLAKGYQQAARDSSN